MMKIPRYIKKGNYIYEFVQKYPNFYMYEHKQTGIKVCMDRFDLVGGGLKTQKLRRTRWEIKYG